MNGSSTSAGPSIVAPGPSRGAVVDGRVHEVDAEVHRALAGPRVGGVGDGRRAAPIVGGLSVRPTATRRTPAHHRLLVAEREPAVGLVQVVEAVARSMSHALVDRVAAEHAGTLMSKFWPGYAICTNRSVVDLVGRQPGRRELLVDLLVDLVDSVRTVAEVDPGERR